MTQNTPPGINDLLGLFGGNNPFSVVTKSIGQFQRGVSDFLSAVENFNKTMEQMHVMANRVNILLDTVEEPIKSLVPQISRTIKTADAMVEQLSAPIDRVVPGLSTLADVLSSPTLTAVPKELADFMAVLVRAGAPAAAPRQRWPSPPAACSASDPLPRCSALLRNLRRPSPQPPSRYWKQSSPKPRQQGRPRRGRSLPRRLRPPRKPRPRRLRPPRRRQRRASGNSLDGCGLGFGPRAPVLAPTAR